jgi:hypothetical protein
MSTLRHSRNSDGIHHSTQRTDRWVPAVVYGLASLRHGPPSDISWEGALSVVAAEMHMSFPPTT